MQKSIAASCVLCWFFFMPGMLVGQDSDQSFSEEKKTEIDARLRMMWTDLRKALADKDAEKALTYFGIWSRERYRKLFSALGDHLPAVAGEMQNIELVYIRSHSAKYYNRKTELYGGKKVSLTYDVYFVVDLDGSWKIDWY
jgi:hypothetical protein